jgi:hypothetical protein
MSDEKKVTNQEEDPELNELLDSMYKVLKYYYKKHIGGIKL